MATTGAADHDAGRESVWDYPRPPRLERTDKRIRIDFGGRTLADTQNAYRVLETSHPPVYYLPPTDVDMARLTAGDRRTLCEFKGIARYWSIADGDTVAIDVAWSYPEPWPAFAAITDYLAFYPSRVEACFVDDERVQAQEGDFYGGWITSGIVGPFKGGPGTRGW